MANTATVALNRPAATSGGRARAGAEPSDVSAYVSVLADGRRSLLLMIEGIHCGGCVAKIERAARALPGIRDARVNMTTRRLTATWDGAPSLGNRLVAT